MGTRGNVDRNVLINKKLRCSLLMTATLGVHMAVAYILIVVPQKPFFDNFKWMNL